MKPRTIARILSGGRVAIGATLMAAPPLVTRHWVGEAEADRIGARVLAVGLGGRDLVIGAGALSSLRSGGYWPWLVAGACSDLSDLAGVLRWRDELPRGAVAAMVVLAGGSAAAGGWLAAQGDL